ncbi:MFS transporter [Dactylosporangium sp. NPDC051484]|uniref:MFS transporter n=1 Tax=Dactylosporangium sp. NPDC051484 TaxID=3154942 RepID=UPI00344B6E7F
MAEPAPVPAAGSLWRDADFVKFWSAETLSLLGAQISLVAIPLLAVTTLSATPFEMGVVTAAQTAPFLLFTLLAGVWVDRVRRLPLLRAANFGRAVVYGVIPLAIVLDLMNIGLLGVLVFVGATLTVVFDLAYQSYLPSLVGNHHLIDANGRLEGSRSFAQAAGPGLGGLLVGVLTAPIAIVVDAATYLISATTLLTVRRKEPTPEPEPGPQTSLLTQIGRGVRLAVSNTYLRALGAEAATYNLFNQMLWAVLILFLSRSLHLSALTIGIALSAEGVGALLGSTVAARLSRRHGLGRTLIASIVVANLAPLLIPAAGGSPVTAAVIVGLALFVNGAGLSIYAIQAISVRQAAVTSDVLGRTNAGYRFAVTGAAAIGALAGGALGGWIGLRPTMLIGGLGTLAAIWFVVRSPIPQLRDLTELEPESATAEARAATAAGDQR